MDLTKIIAARHHDPHVFLGPHHEKDGASFEVRTFQPHATAVTLLVADTEIPMRRIHDAGIYHGSLHGDIFPRDYRLRTTWPDGHETTVHDPYAFPPLLSDYDRHLFHNGTHYRLYEKMGAHFTTIDNVNGVVFRVWAPNAQRVSVIGNCNGWDGRIHPMRSLGLTGIWELFIPDLGEYELYKFELLDHNGGLHTKTDPFQFHGELRPSTASMTTGIPEKNWRDDVWMSRRSRRPVYREPVSIYELHLGSWRRDPADPRRFLTFKEIASALIPYVSRMGFTHIELMPVMEHPLDESWGYQVTGYFSVTSRHGTPREFMEFVESCHQAGIGVLLDWVPAHFPTDATSLARFDGTALYEHEDPRRGLHPDWNTLIFNYGRKEIANFLIASALFWLDIFHVDGLRVDAVASMLYLDYSRADDQWLPNIHGGRENLEAIEFLRHLNSIVYQRHPDIMMIAEESTSFYGVTKPNDQGGLGFGFKWNMGWMNDTLAYFATDSLYRKYHHNSLTFSLLYAFSENFILPLSHDEVVHGKGSLLQKMPGDQWQKFANLRLLLFFHWCHPGKKMVFMGDEFGQPDEWNALQSLPWHLIEQDSLHAKTRFFLQQLNRVYLDTPCLWEKDFSPEGFAWIDCDNSEQSVLSFARYGRTPEEHAVCLFNCTPRTYAHYKTGVMAPEPYCVRLHTDHEAFGGSGVHPHDILHPLHAPHAKAPFHVELTLPPLAGVLLQPWRDNHNP